MSIRVLNKLISKKHNGLIKVVTGMRRCGKSYLLFNLFKEYLVNEGVNENHIIEIAFDSFENRKYRDPEVLFPYLMEKIADKEMYYVLLRHYSLVSIGVIVSPVVLIFGAVISNEVAVFLHMI